MTEQSTLSLIIPSAVVSKRVLVEVLDIVAGLLESCGHAELAAVVAVVSAVLCVTPTAVITRTARTLLGRVRMAMAFCRRTATSIMAASRRGVSALCAFCSRLWRRN